MSNIRVTYSGLISLAVGFVSVLLGLLFTLIVTRTLNAIEYGTWGLIGGVIVYATIIEPMISYWAIRESARNIESGRTAVTSSLLVSLGGLLIYLISAYFVGVNTNADQNTVILGSLLVPLIFLNRILTSISYGWKPQSAAFGQICFAITEISIGSLLVYVLDLGTVGVIYSVAASYSASIIFLLIYSRDRLKNKIQKEFLKKWIKLSWVSLYPAIGITVLFFDVTIFSIITGSVIGIAFWTASLVIVNFISNSGLISRAVYPKLLQDNNHAYLSENIRQLFYFTILFTALVITFAKPGLFALNPEYVFAVPIVIVLSLQIFLFTITSNFQTFITGIEQVDVNQNSTFKDYFKSKLFYIPTVSLIQSIIYLISLTILLYMLISYDYSQLDLVISWSILSLSVQIPASVTIFILVKRNFSLQINLKEIFKYVFSSIIAFGITYILLESFLQYDIELFEFLSITLLFVLIGITIYFGFTFIFDSKTRNLFNVILNRISNNNS